MMRNMNYSNRLLSAISGRSQATATGQKQSFEQMHGGVDEIRGDLVAFAKLIESNKPTT
jgi:predicted hydrolase (HD superfamily)